MKKLLLLIPLLFLFGCKAEEEIANDNDYVCPGTPVVNYEGKVYNTVQIGKQCWLNENLNIGTRINGSQEQSNNSIIEKYCYDDDVMNCIVYGGLYQWDEMMNYINTEGAQGICPNGWHIPTDDEYKTLEGAVDSQYGIGDQIWNQSTFRGFDSGKNLKSSYGWMDNGNGINEYGFTALPGGYLLPEKSFIYLTERAIFWTSTEGDALNSLIRQFRYSEDNSGRYTPDKRHGFAIRCLMDN
jgi:uncharacterized protein (TIGR02145 family)